MTPTVFRIALIGIRHDEGAGRYHKHDISRLLDLAIEEPPALL